MTYILFFQLQTMLSMDEKAIINNTQEFKQQIIQLLESLHSHTSKGKIFLRSIQLFEAKLNAKFSKTIQLLRVHTFFVFSNKLMTLLSITSLVAKISKIS